MSFPVLARRIALLVLGMTLAAAPALAQARPRLPKDADPRDWASYLECARRDDVAREEEQACLRWAHRLDPERADVPYVAWLKSRRKDATALEEARLLDPFINEARFVALETKPGAITNPRKRAGGYLRSGDWLRASQDFARWLASSPADREALWGAATAYHFLGRHDSAAVALGALDHALDGEAKRDPKAPYPSRTIVRWALAQSWLAAEQADSALAVLARLTTDDPSFFRARALEGDARLARGDTAGALASWQAAVDASHGDLVTRARYGRFLLRAGQGGESARTVLDAVVADAPDWANARRDLARALEAAGPSRETAAVSAWRDYLERAPARDDAGRKDAERGLAVLQARR